MHYLLSLIRYPANNKMDMLIICWRVTTHLWNQIWVTLNWYSSKMSTIMTGANRRRKISFLAKIRLKSILARSVVTVAMASASRHEVRILKLAHKRKSRASFKSRCQLGGRYFREGSGQPGWSSRRLDRWCKRKACSTLRCNRSVMILTASKSTPNTQCQ